MASRQVFKSIRSLSTIFRNGLKLNQLQKPANISLLNLNSRAFSATTFRLQQSNVFQDLTNFLTEEIKQEHDAQKHKTKLPTIPGFDVKTEGPNVTLTKKHNNEEITIKFNVNGSIDDSDHNLEDLEAAGKAEKSPEVDFRLKSKPSFSVDIKKGSRVLSFGCSYYAADEGDKNAIDDFQIDEFAIHDGDWNENVYTADGMLIDGNLYDILLNLLDERGVGEEFASQLTEFSTAYENKQYINLLESLKSFASEK